MKYAIFCTLAFLCQLAAPINLGYCQQKTDKLDSPYYGFVETYQQSLRFGWVPESRAWETEPSGDQFTKVEPGTTKEQQYLRQSYDGTLKKGDKVTSTINFTPPLIIENGHENTKYVVMISAQWCHYCKEMYPLIRELRQQGYIIYIFETDRPEFANYADLYAAKAFPTFVVFDKGHEIDRTMGVTNKQWFTNHFKPEKVIYSF